MTHAKFNSKKFAEFYATEIIQSLSNRFGGDWIPTYAKEKSKWSVNVGLVDDEGQTGLYVSPLEKQSKYAVTIFTASYTDSIESDDPSGGVDRIMIALHYALKEARENKNIDKEKISEFSDLLRRLNEPLRITGIDHEDPVSSDLPPFSVGDPPYGVKAAHATGVIKRVGQMVRNGNTIFLFAVEARYGSKFRFIKGGIYNIAIDSTIDLVARDPVPILALAQVGDLLQIDFDGFIHEMTRVTPTKLTSYGVQSGPW